jgi:preprotein translocase subunit SecD
MLNRYPLWVYLLVVAVLLTGAVLALPNLYGEDPAVQISADQRGVEVDEALAARAGEALQGAGLAPVATERTENRLLVRFGGTEEQLRAQEVLREALGGAYVVALNLAPATPGWLEVLGVLPMYLGLDLRGGVHFLLEVDMPAAVRQAEERYVNDLRTLLRNEKLRYRAVTLREDGAILVSFAEPEVRTQAYDLMRRHFDDLVVTEEAAGGDYALAARLSEVAVRELKRFALQQNLTTLRNRVNELGVAEPVIQQQGEGRIVVQLPGVQDTARAKEILGATATLEFRMVDEEHVSPKDMEDAEAGRPPINSRLYRDREGRPILLDRRVIITGDHITGAASGIEQQSGTPAVFITLDARGAGIMADRTKDRVGKRMAVVFIENKVETRRGAEGEPVRVKRTVEEVINVAVIRERLAKRFQISGLDSSEEARDLALLLRAGALAAPMEIVEERVVGPSLGADNVRQGFLASVVGLLLSFLFMALYYRLFGLVAGVALLLNVVLVVAVMSMLQATLTLPGIAGIVLSVGMAVDANVLIYERVREELRAGNTPQAAIHAGYERAFTTILDSNVTTIIAALALFGLGSGPIRGFAVTLIIGIVTSMFTAIVGTRAVINLVYGGRRVPALSI